MAAGLVGISVCGILAVGALLLVPSARPTGQFIVATRTVVVVGAMPTSEPQTEPGLLDTPSGGGGGGLTPRPQATVAAGGAGRTPRPQATLAPGAGLPTSTPEATLGGEPPNPAPQATELPAPTAAIEASTGQLRFDYPLTLLVDKDEIVQVEIVPDRPVALAGAGAFAPAARLLVETGPEDAERKNVAYAIPLYPVMSAELATARTDDLYIAAGSESKQEINPFDRNFWTWSVVARRSGEYRVTLRLFGYNALTDDDPVRQVVNDTRILRVQERPMEERLMQGLADNWLILFGAGGPIALVVAMLSLWFARRESRK